jgi:hypothetical protein
MTSGPVKVRTLAQGPGRMNAVIRRARIALAIPEREVEPEVRPIRTSGQLAGHGEDDQATDLKGKK